MRALHIALAVLTLGVKTTPVAAQCAGDCDASGIVAVNELVVGVNIALDRAALEACASLDSDGSGAVAVNELVAAVNNALRGCEVTAGPTATATATPTASVPVTFSPTFTATSPISTATPTITATFTITPSTTITPTASATPEMIGGVSTRLLGFFNGTVTIGTDSFPGRLKVEISDLGPVATDLSSPAPFIFPNPVQMIVVSPTELLYEFNGPPLVRFTLALNQAGHLIGRYTNEDPETEIDYDLVKDE